MTLFPFRSVTWTPWRISKTPDKYGHYMETTCRSHIPIAYSRWLTSRSRSHLRFKCHMTVCILLGICSWLQCSCFYLGDPFLLAYFFIELLPKYVTINSIFCNFFIIGSMEKPRPLFCGTTWMVPPIFWCFLTFLYLVRIFGVGTYIFFV
jgi:hypothetical protein